MSFARTAAITLAALLISWNAATAGGPYRPFHIGLWSGGAYTDDRTGGFSHCSAGVAFDSGINLFLVNSRTHAWWLGFWNPQWSFAPNASVPIKLRFDGQSPLDLLAAAAGEQTLVVPLPNDQHLIDKIERSSQLALIVQERSSSFNLVGTSTAMSELTSCVRTSLTVETTSSPAAPSPATSSPLETNPASPPTAPPASSSYVRETDAVPSSSTPPTVPSGPVEAKRPSSPVASPAGPPTSPHEPALPTPVRYPSEPEEVELARNFLLAARLPNAHLIDKDKPAALAQFSAVWKSDNAAGAVRIVPPNREVTGVAIASELIAVDPLLCKGNFASARSSESVAGGIVHRAVLSCTEGRDELTAQYFIAPRRSGGFVVFAVIGNSGAEGGSISEGPPVDVLKRAAAQAAGPGD